MTPEERTNRAMIVLAIRDRLREIEDALDDLEAAEESAGPR